MNEVIDPMLFELCAESLEAALAGERGGADRIELCSNLDCGGLTPDAGLRDAAIEALTVPVHLLIRPRPGDFVFSPGEFEQMQQQIEEARRAGAAGVVVGMLHSDGTVDVERSRELIALARPMEITFHRAFDQARELRRALEDVIATGADRLLTSGGAADIHCGAELIGALHRQAGKRMEIVAGGGLRLGDLAEFLRRSGVFSVHGSLGRRNGALRQAESLRALEGDVRRAVNLLHSAQCERNAAGSIR